MPKLKVPSLSSKPAEKAPSLLQHPSQPNTASSPLFKRGPRMKSCVAPAAKAKRVEFPRHQNGLKANIAFKEAFGGSDDEV